MAAGSDLMFAQHSSNWSSLGNRRGKKHYKKWINQEKVWEWEMEEDGRESGMAAHQS